jgi:hypothetical protein
MRRAILGTGPAVPRKGGQRVQLHGCGGKAGRPARGPARLGPSSRRAQRVLWEEAAEREAALSKLMPLGPF